ncbi:hypothetical protein HNQ51_000288 [Inhella inkyongensis]|uniref:Lipoprotein n=1 Tax=Inhella inkyongensis TaxID=392593 RepID=A0A840RYG2_9BURK|nr:hypothetical protein [Inhella inkyongensis]MBB5202995.1 hypothetical protein [Inhella inkyongensis]
MLARQTARRTVLLALPALLAGCSSAVQSPPLAISARQALQWRSFVDDQLKGQIALGEVTGADAPAVGYLRKTLAWLWGSRTSPDTVGDALEDQLRALRLLAPLPGTGRYQLDTQLMALEAEGLLGPSEAQAQVEYRLREKGEGGRLIYQRRIRSQAKAGWLDHGFASERQRLAKEAALRASLMMLAQDLVALRV